jgi:hypothetical protein
MWTFIGNFPRALESVIENPPERSVRYPHKIGEFYRTVFKAHLLMNMITHKAKGM